MEVWSCFSEIQEYNFLKWVGSTWTIWEESIQEKRIQST